MHFKASKGWIGCAITLLVVAFATREAKLEVESTFSLREELLGHLQDQLFW